MKLRELIPLAAAAAILGKRRGGKKTHVSTLTRWGNEGLRGVKLKTIRAGGIRCTSVAELQKFFAALSALDARETSERGGQTPAASVAPSTPSQSDVLVDAGLRAKRLIDPKDANSGPVTRSDDGIRVGEASRSGTQARGTGSTANRGDAR